MSDHDDKLRDILELTDCSRGQWEPLLDALVAERDRWRAVACNVKDGTQTAEAEVDRLNHENGALEEEVRALREALIVWWEPQRHVGNCACRACTLTRAVLAPKDKG